MASVSRNPSLLTFQTENTRRCILVSYWIVIILATPLWWYATSIQRLALPTARVNAQADRVLRFPVDIGIQHSDTDLIRELGALVQERIVRAPERWTGIDVNVHEHRRNYMITPGPDVQVQSRELVYPLQDRALSELADLLAALIVPYSVLPEQEHRVAQYSPRYRLAFTLLNEDASAGNAAKGWGVSEAINRRISPVLTRLSVLHNFTIESQVQFHAPLAFTPKSLDDGSYGISPEDLTVFINSAEWTLSSSVSNDHVLHFVLFIPSATRRPLHILESNGRIAASKAFLLPQWGGIVIHNPPPQTPSHFHLSVTDLDPIFSTFNSQLLALLGVPRLPVGVHEPSKSTSVLSDWQLDALLRRRALENEQGSQDTLRSIVKLVDQIENMPVGQDVRDDIQDALAALDKVYESSSSSLTETMKQSAIATTLASRAFFNPGMLALLYFPAEHKYAVYTPLFASALIPLVGAVIREGLAWKRKRKAAMLDRQKTD